ncbi:MAG: hypothetical protein AAGG11_01110 [Pseudomonadota bacterium]
MGRPKILEVEYHEFFGALTKAIDAGHRLEKSDGQPWQDFVEAQSVNEVAMASWGRSKFQKVEPVIITNGRWTGYYVYSKDDEGCLKWTMEED